MNAVDTDYLQNKNKKMQTNKYDHLVIIGPLIIESNQYPMPTNKQTNKVWYPTHTVAATTTTSNFIFFSPCSLSFQRIFFQFIIQNKN